MDIAGCGNQIVLSAGRCELCYLAGAAPTMQLDNAGCWQVWVESFEKAVQVAAGWVDCLIARRLGAIGGQAQLPKAPVVGFRA